LVHSILDWLTHPLSSDELDHPKIKIKACDPAAAGQIVIAIRIASEAMQKVLCLAAGTGCFRAIVKGKSGSTCFC
jgi:hypothetical protein